MEVLRKQIGGVEVVYTRLGLGLAALGRPGYINLGHGEDLPDRSKEAMLHRAVEVLDELARLRDGGLVIGLSVSGPQQASTVEKALEVRRDGRQVFGSVQATWNLHERSVGPALAAAHAAGWLVIVKEGLANGRL